MSKLSQLAGKPKTFKIGGVDLELYPRNGEDLDLFMDSSEENKIKILKELIKKSLKESVPDSTDEEINNISLKYWKDLAVAVSEVNGFTIKDGSTN